MKTTLAFLGFAPVLVLVFGLLRPDLVLGNESLSASMIWSLIGTLFSYLGFVFSFYAVLEVKSLSNRYFAKQRLPEIKKQLEKITKSMTALADSKLSDIRTERFMSEAAVTIRQVKLTRVSGFSGVIKRAETHHAEVNRRLKDTAGPMATANGLGEYWDLFSALTELADEIEAYSKGAQASL